MPVDLHLNDILTLKKPHACGTNSWEVYRLGADIGLRCTGCDRRVLIPRSQLERRIRLITRGGESFKPSHLSASH
ncbi:MAG: hypothetical protein Kow00124_00680 [Anaerolineae bacterium]